MGQLWLHQCRNDEEQREAQSGSVAEEAQEARESMEAVSGGNAGSSSVLGPQSSVLNPCASVLHEPLGNMLTMLPSSIKDSSRITHP